MQIAEQVFTSITPLTSKVDVPRVLESSEFFNKISGQLQICIDQYDQVRAEVPNLLINCQHLSSIWKQPLPRYLDIISRFQTKLELRTAVLDELTSSDYFQEVWELRDETLAVNILILIYRTCLLHKYPELRENKAQISSCLEELAWVIHLQDPQAVPDLTQAVKHWVINWQEEGFSEQLAAQIENT